MPYQPIFETMVLIGNVSSCKSKKGSSIYFLFHVHLTMSIYIYIYHGRHNISSPVNLSSSIWICITDDYLENIYMITVFSKILSFSILFALCCPHLTISDAPPLSPLPLPLLSSSYTPFAPPLPPQCRPIRGQTIKIYPISTSPTSNSYGSCTEI